VKVMEMGFVHFIIFYDRELLTKANNEPVGICNTLTGFKFVSCSAGMSCQCARIGIKCNLE